MIVAGPKGIGKSTMTSHVCKDLQVIVTVNIEAGDTASDNHWQTVVENVVLTGKDLFHPWTSSFRLYRKNTSYDRTQVLRGAVYSIGKTVSIFANVVIVVSEANATLGFTNEGITRRQEIRRDTRTSKETTKSRNVSSQR